MPRFRSPRQTCIFPVRLLGETAARSFAPRIYRSIFHVPRRPDFNAEIFIASARSRARLRPRRALIALKARNERLRAVNTRDTRPFVIHIWLLHSQLQRKDV